MREASSGGSRVTVQFSFSTYPPDRWVTVDLPTKPPALDAHQRVLARHARNVRISKLLAKLWGLVPEAQNRALRVITLEDRETIHNAFFDRGFLRARTRSQPSPPAAPSAP